jgi:tetrahydromethanopterin S-methyltransferase subunit D
MGFLLLHFLTMQKYIVATAIALAPLVAFANGTGSTTGTGTTQTGTTQTGTTQTGSVTERETKGLMLAIGALSPTDRATLVKMIRDYLLSKGVDPAKYAEKRDEIRESREDMRDKIKDMRKATREDIKKKRDEMKEKIKSLKNK